MGIFLIQIIKYLFIDFGVSQNITKEDQEEFLEFFIYLMKKNLAYIKNDFSFEKIDKSYIFKNPSNIHLLNTS